MNTALEIISLWPSRSDLAADIGVDLTAVHAWVKRKRIAAEHDVAIVDAANRRGIVLTYEDLARHRTSQNITVDKSRHSAHRCQASTGRNRETSGEVA